MILCSLLVVSQILFQVNDNHSASFPPLCSVPMPCPALRKHPPGSLPPPSHPVALQPPLLLRSVAKSRRKAAVGVGGDEQVLSSCGTTLQQSIWGPAWCGVAGGSRMLWSRNMVGWQWDNCSCTHFVLCNIFFQITL